MKTAQAIHSQTNKTRNPVTTLHHPVAQLSLLSNFRTLRDPKFHGMNRWTHPIWSLTFYGAWCNSGSSQAETKLFLNQE